MQQSELDEQLPERGEELQAHTPASQLSLVQSVDWRQELPTVWASQV